MKRSFYYLIFGIIFVLSIAAGKRPTTLFLAGDSTMADKTEIEVSPERGWGQLLPTYFKENLVIENHAKNGRSTRSFITEGRWDYMMGRVQKGDIVLIQFGHNDAKKEDKNRYADTTVYRYNLMRMVYEVRQKDATPVLVTPIVRREFDENGVLINTHGDYPDVVRRLAKALKVDMIDMHKASMDMLTDLGAENSKELYINVPAGLYEKYPNGKEDNTHLTEKGALEMGNLAVRLIAKKRIQPLKKYLRKSSDCQTTYTKPFETE